MKKLIENIKKAYKENKQMQKVMSEKDFNVFVDTFSEEFKTIVKKEITMEKKRLAEQYKNYSKSMKSLYEEKTKAIMGETIKVITKVTAKEGLKKAVNFTEGKINSLLKENISNINSSVKSEIRRAVRENIKSVKNYVTTSKYNFVAERIKEMVKKLGIEENVDYNKKIKMLAKKYNNKVKENKKLKNKTAVEKMNRIFNELFSNYSELQKENIKSILKSKKYKSISEFKTEVNILKKGLKEGFIANREDMKKVINERNNKKSLTEKNKIVINNNNKTMTEQEKKINDILEQTYKNMKK